MAHVKLSKEECDLVAWALEVMPEAFQERVEAGEFESMPTLPTLERRALVRGDAAPMRDLLYRVTTQAAARDLDTLLAAGKRGAYEKSCRIRSGLERKLLKLMEGF